MRKTVVAIPLTAIFTAALTAVAIATTFTDTQANQPQVAGDPTSNSTARFPTNKQNEPTIAVSPDGHFLAGANDEQKQPPCGPGVDMRVSPFHGRAIRRLDVGYGPMVRRPASLRLARRRPP